MSEFDSTARAFIAASFEVLRAENAIPTSTSHRYLQHGLDFNGMTIEKLPEYSHLSDEVLAAAPVGLPDDSDFVGPGYTVSLLLFSFLELCVEKCSRADNYDPDNDEVTAAIIQFADVLSGQPYDMVLARHVSHLVPTAGQEIEISGITIVPDDSWDLRHRIMKEIPDADHAWKRRAPNPGRPPHALLIVRRQVSGVGYHDHGALEDVLDRFQLGVCLLTGANVQGMYQVSGASTRISARPASLEHLIRDTDVPLVRRTARLTGSQEQTLSALTDLIDSVQQGMGGQDIWLSSFGEALEKFAKFDDTTSHFEQVVELSTALEGVILGANEGEGLTLRLCTRVTALLADEDDPARTLFEDLKRLYNFRSTIVHGGELTTKQIRKDLEAMECVPDETNQMSELARVGYAVDRLRDIVRRAILARICLAVGDSPLWPLKDKGKVKIDTVLSDDTNRAKWRAHWRGTLDSLGAGSAASRSGSPVYSLSDEDL
ncbi:hypothetical protein ACL02S_22680 [Nocardia sp. 004]|uniref:hypothetical protein n=1 Tax=Nocardia sp. 004 TaxID=3385978 RepID=UPI0039A1FEE2